LGVKARAWKQVWVDGRHGGDVAVVAMVEPGQEAVYFEWGLG
jgi:hypothetical protein